MSNFRIQPDKDILERMANLALLAADANLKGEHKQAEFLRGQLAGIAWATTSCDMATALEGADRLTEAAYEYPALLASLDGLTG